MIARYFVRNGLACFERDGLLWWYPDKPFRLDGIDYIRDGISVCPRPIASLEDDGMGCGDPFWGSRPPMTDAELDHWVRMGRIIR